MIFCNVCREVIKPMWSCRLVIHDPEDDKPQILDFCCWRCLKDWVIE